ncbi:MAG TPA: metal ABC transporter permease, partial [Methanoregula sp.]|nr:metal ABC transporter permease [Methanoregula sp.]
MVLEFLAYQFGVRALIGGLIIAVTCSGLGVFLVLRRLSLVADGLSHVAFGGIAFGLYSGIYPLYTAVAGVILGALGIHALGKLRVASDAAIAILFAAGLAIGIMLISVTQNVAVDVLSFLFGTILGINQTDLLLAAALGIIVVGILLLFWKEWVSITVDAEFARVSGLPVPALELVFTILTGLTVVVAMRLVGVLLVSSLIVIPASAMIQLKMPFRRTVLSACAVAVVSVVAGLQLSFMYNLAPGGSIVFVTILFFILAAVGVRL